MKKIGMIGGLAWPSTVDYYRLICSRANRHFAERGVAEPHPVPPMHIESVNINYTRRLRGTEDDEGSWAAFDSFFRDSLRHLESSGVDLAFIASNTPHMRLHRIREGIGLPIISILDTTAAAIAARSYRRVQLLGTPVTMRSRAYSDALGIAGVEVVGLPRAGDIDTLQHLIDTDIHEGRFEQPREWLLSRGKAARNEPGAEAIVLACTELPLVFPELEDAAFGEVDGLTLVNTTVLHADAVVEAALAEG